MSEIKNVRQNWMALNTADVIAINTSLSLFCCLSVAAKYGQVKIHSTQLTFWYI